MESVSSSQFMDPGKLIEDFCGDCKLRGMSGESIRRYKSSLVTFSSFLLARGTNICDVDLHVLKDFLQYLSYRNVKHKTAENYFSRFQPFLSTLFLRVLVRQQHGAVIPKKVSASVQRGL